MANVLVNDASLADIADAIREKNGTEETYKPAEMGDAVRAIESGGGVGIILKDFNSTGSPLTVDIRGLQSHYDNLKDNSKIRFSGNLSYLCYNFGSGPTNGLYTQTESIYLIDGLDKLPMNMFYYCSSLKNVYGDLSKVATLGNNCFAFCTSLTELPYMPSLNKLDSGVFNGCTGLTKIKLYTAPSKASDIHNFAFLNCTNITDIYVPWAEGAVDKAPWGATNATIHYNTVYDENHEPIV